ncbi:hypothetical protein FR932_05235 [Moritella marina ATCC 15381]|uniref:Uncharacterized protein n=1 Tax=Moritella marina ATCC 15381 TaxID=1202962 RepID=A0A5J6WLF5_MORMI|nr:hypothetical protein [Moritella marina]QFI37272.1 hypothetical protein FR932_05235 [Moritella marina ATCC 15381]
MSIEMMSRVARFKAKAQNVDWPDNLVDFESSNFCVSGIKPLIEVMDEIHSSFVWCWSMKDYLKKTLYELNKNTHYSGKKKTNRENFGDHFENEVNKYKELTLCADIANSEKHGGLDRKPRSGEKVRLDISHLLNISKHTIANIQRLDGQYYITPKCKDAVKIKVNIINENDVIISDAFLCIDKSLKAWDEISSTYSST